MAVSTRPSKLSVVRSHSKEIERVIKPHLDRVAEACFSRIIISARAYSQLVKCDRARKPTQLLLAIKTSVARIESNYDAFLRVLQDTVPKESLENLLEKMNAALQARPYDEGVHKTSSVPAKLHSKVVPERTRSSSREVLQVKQQDVGDDGGLQLRTVPRSNESEELEEEPKKLTLPVQETQHSDVDDYDEHLEELIEPIEESKDAENRPTSLKQRKFAEVQNDKHSADVNVDKALEGDRTGVHTALNWWRQTRLECQQQEAVIQDLLEEVKRLRDQLSSAHEEENNLIIETQKLSENIEALRHQQKEEVSALRKQIEDNERLRVHIADVEAERHQLKEKVHSLTVQSEADHLEFEKQKTSIDEKYKEEIKKSELKRDQLQEEIDRLYEEIPRLENTIIYKEECIDKEKPSPSLFYRFCNSLPFVGMLLLFLLALVAFLQL